MRWLRKLMFWRDEPVTPDESEVDGCFTLPGVPLDAIEPVAPGSGELRDDACD